MARIPSAQQLRKRAHDTVSLAVTLRRGGRLAEAITAYERASADFEAVGDREAAAATANNAGTTCLLGGNPAAAEEHFARATALSVGPSRAAANAMGNLGLVARERGDLVTAAEWFHRAREAHREAGNPGGAAECLGNLGLNALARQELGEAQRLLTEALVEFRQLGLPGGVITALNALGEVRRSLGDTAGARDRFAESLSVAEAAGLSDGRRIALQNLGNLARQAGDLAEAERAYSVALSHARSAGDVPAARAALNNLAHVFTASGRRDDARRALEESLELSPPGTSGVSYATDLANLASLDQEEGGLDDVLARLRRAERLFTDAARPREALLVRLGAAQVRAQLGDLQGAREELAAVEHRAGEVSNEPIALAAAASLAGLSVCRTPFSESERSLRECAMRFEALGDRRGRASSLGLRAEVLGWMGRWTEADGLAREAEAFFRESAIPQGAADVLTLQASLAERRGDPEAATVGYAAALSAQVALGLPLGRARAHLGLARSALWRGRRAESSEHVVAARRLFERFPHAAGLAECAVLSAWGSGDAAELRRVLPQVEALELAALRALAALVLLSWDPADQASRDALEALESRLGAALWSAARTLLNEQGPRHS